MVDAAHISRVHLVAPVFGAVPLVHLALAIGARQRRRWASLGSKLTGGHYLARLRIHSI